MGARRARRLAYGVAAMLGVCPPALAHHSYAMFDPTREVVLTGTVKDWQWTNPHSWLVLMVPGAGAPREWGIEGQSPGVLRMFGWKRDMVKPGDAITVRINPLRSGGLGGQMTSVIGADGHVYGHPAPPK